MRKFLAGTAFGAVSIMLLLLSPHGKAAQQAPNPNERTMTILYDPKTLGALQRSGGLKVMWWKNGDKFVSLGEPRWLIPAKVKPQIWGEGTGTEYYYFDQITGQKEGPFKPDTKQ